MNIERPNRKFVQEAVAAPRSILIVEDEPSAREATALYLESLGHSVATAAGAAEAFTRAAARRPDVVVCDWRLGAGPDGVEVARHLQREYGVAVIFATAHPLDELREASGAIDVAQFFRKPISLPRLADAIAAAEH